VVSQCYRSGFISYPRSFVNPVQHLVNDGEDYWYGMVDCLMVIGDLSVESIHMVLVLVLVQLVIKIAVSNIGNVDRELI